jgi:hypothetical protein
MLAIENNSEPLRSSSVAHKLTNCILSARGTSAKGSSAEINGLTKENEQGNTRL